MSAVVALGIGAALAAWVAIGFQGLTVAMLARRWRGTAVGVPA